MTLQNKPHLFTSYTLHDTWHRFGDPEHLKAWKEAPQSVRRIRSPGIQDSNLPDREIFRRHRVKQELNVEQLGAAIHSGIKEKLKRGSLIAWGRPGLPAEDWISIQKEAWDYLSLDFTKGIASVANGMCYFSVRISRSVIVSKKWKSETTLDVAGELLASSERTSKDNTEKPSPEQKWKLIIAGAIDYEDLFIWGRNQNSNKWRKIDRFFKNGLPEFEAVDIANSLIRVAELEEQIYCVVSRLDKSPSYDDFDIMNNFKITEPTVPGKNKFEEKYKERVRTWPPGKVSPSRDEDEEWGKLHGIKQKKIYALRNQFAPEFWKWSGPKSKRINLVKKII